MGSLRTRLEYKLVDENKSLPRYIHKVRVGLTVP